MTRRRLCALQVEVTSRCTRGCAVCARTVFADRWLDGDMAMTVWSRLVPDLERTRHVHLQGWGEPLLHDGLRSMVRDAHGAGCEVGITTNGDLLEGASEWIVAEEVDVVAVSLAGECSGGRPRDSAEVEVLLDRLAGIARLRRRHRRPRLHISYLLVDGNAAELCDLVGDAASHGVDAVLISHLDGVFSPELLDMTAYRDGGVAASAREALDRAAAVARRHGMEFRRPGLEPREMLTCDLDPRRILSIGWDGRVGPCVHQNLPIDGPIRRWTPEGSVDVEPVAFGHLGEAALSRILEGEPYRRFTEPLRRRCDADERFREEGLVASAWGDVAVRELNDAHRAMERVLDENPFPDACRGCPKLGGW